MNILVAGSKGFIGSHLVDYFSAKHNVTGCDIRPESNTHNYRFITSISDYENILREKQYDLFINASGSSGVGFSILHPEKDRELNALNVERMLAAIEKHSPQTKFINFSSAAVYGNPKQLPITEMDETHPLSPYGKHKLEAEEILKKYHREFGLSTCSVRVFSAYGPGLHKQLFWDIYMKVKDTPNVRLYGTGKESRDFIFITDLVCAIETIAQHAPLQGECLNVSSGIETSIEEVAKLFLDELGLPYTLSFSGEEKEGDPINWRADVSKLKKLGFTPSFSIREGLKITAADYRKKI